MNDKSHKVQYIDPVIRDFHILFVRMTHKGYLPCKRTQGDFRSDM